jgi:hypothetical protein
LSRDLETEHKIHSRLKSSLVWLEEMDLSSTTEANIFTELLAGRRTIAELAEIMYHVRRDNERYSTYYDKIRRAMGPLEAKGYVSRRIFGRDKPYGLTRFAKERILAANLGTGNPKILSLADTVLYTLTLLMAALSWALAKQVTTPPRGAYSVLYSAFLLAAGMSITRFVEMMRRVL